MSPTTRVPRRQRTSPAVDLCRSKSSTSLSSFFTSVARDPPNSFQRMYRIYISPSLFQYIAESIRVIRIHVVLIGSRCFQFRFTCR